MVTVYKYPIPFLDYSYVEMPLGAEILCVMNQREEICLWAKVDTDVTTSVKRKFRVAGTGHPLVDKPENYLGSAIYARGSLVFHVFEVEVE